MTWMGKHRLLPQMTASLYLGRGGEAAKSARERKKALEAWERTDEPVPLEQQETGQLALAMDAWAAGRPFLLW